MNESKFIETLFERYVNNLATDKELEVFMDLLRQGKLDEITKEHMDREADNEINTDLSTAGWLKPWGQWMRIAASVALILW